MTGATRERVAALTKRAARRTMTVRKAEEVGVWELANPWRVVVTGTLDNVADWLTAAEERDRDGGTRPLDTVGSRADG
ncbi:hypothetical protein AB0L62_17795 [Nocardia asteroides]|uniref:hypothetical protein n=1 Tax=Nocardia asteroides TaxID=1824 RepID=UPI003448BA6F